MQERMRKLHQLTEDVIFLHATDDTYNHEDDAFARSRALTRLVAYFATELTRMQIDGASEVEST
ncbi:MAG: hypothetical protein V4568_18210 [Pseudomonadota bacterium]